MAFLTMGEKIRLLVKRKGFTLAALAVAIETTQQNLSNKLDRDNFSEKELQQIAQALGCRFEGFFVFEDGDMI